MPSRRQLEILLVGWAAILAGCERHSDLPSLDSSKTPTAPPSASVARPMPVKPGTEWFREVTNLTGIDFRHVSGTNDEKPFPAANGSGLGAFDYDLDGRCDLYFATGKPFPIDPQATTPLNRCYRNAGDW